MNLIRYAEDVEGKVENCNEWLQAVFIYAAATLYGISGKRFLITSVYRPDDKGSVHAWWRGIDVDVCDGFVYEGGITPKEAEKVCREINKKFVYDPYQPGLRCAVFGKLDPDGKHDDHIHFQAHYRTHFV